MPLRRLPERLRVRFGLKPSYESQTWGRNQKGKKAAAGNFALTQRDIIDAELMGKSMPSINLNLPPNYLEVNTILFRKRKNYCYVVKILINLASSLPTNDFNIYALPKIS